MTIAYSSSTMRVGEQIIRTKSVKLPIKDINIKYTGK